MMAILVLALVFTIGCEEKESGKAAEAAAIAKAKAEADVKRKLAEQAEEKAAEAYIKANDGIFTDDRDGKKYKMAKIGTKIWMAENLNYSVENSKCPDNNNKACKKYGRLYRWGAASQACPEGWRLPSDDEWQSLVNLAGGEEAAGNKLKAKSGWIDYEKKACNGTDEFGFAALPGGSGFSEGGFGHAGKYGSWWSGTESSASYAWSWNMSNVAKVERNKNYKGNFFSARCVRDSAGSQKPAAKQTANPAKAEEEKKETFIDKRDGHKYPIVKIGTQIWMAENLNYKLPGKSWCFFDDTTNCDKYGRLYPWGTAKKVCPAGFHLPSNGEWEVLGRFLGSERQQSDINSKIIFWPGVGKKLKAASGWRDNGNGTDEFGFAALPGGGRSFNGGWWSGHGSWWTATEKTKLHVYYRDISPGSEDMYDDYTGKQYAAYSVRCVRD